jgi:hypothetical protein
MGDQPGSHRFKVIRGISKKNSNKRKKSKENKNYNFFDFFENSFLKK